MKLLSIDYIPDTKIEALNIVRGTVVWSKHWTKDFKAELKSYFGGELNGYTEMIDEACQLATKRMVDDARELNADAVIGIRYSTSQLMDGVAEIIAYGTAVRIKGEKK